MNRLLAYKFHLPLLLALLLTGVIVACGGAEGSDRGANCNIGARGCAYCRANRGACRPGGSHATARIIGRFRVGRQADRGR